MAHINYIITITIPADPHMSWEKLENDIINPIVTAYPNAVAIESFSMEDSNDTVEWGTLGEAETYRQAPEWEQDEDAQRNQPL